MLFLARSAVAQARGTLQVSATVIDTRVSALSLSTVQQILNSEPAPRKADSVAIIRIERREDDGRFVTVIIEYSRN